MRSVLALAALSAAVVVPLSAQQSGPAPVIQVIREVVKEGKGAAHERAEAAYVRAFRKANSSGYYLALSSISGPSEAWFIMPAASFAAAGDLRAEAEKEPLKSELEAADDRDGAIRESSRSLWAVFRPDMSYHADKFEVSKMRLVSVGTYRTRLGHNEDMLAGARSIIGAYEKAGIDAVLLCYQVIAGAPSGTYLFFSPMESMKVMDEYATRQRAITAAMGADAMSKLSRGMGDTFLSVESNLFMVSPAMSYMSKATEDKDPAFWRPKSAAPRAAAAKPAP